MPFYGELKQSIAYSIDIDNAQNAGGKTAVTILKINRRDNIASAETELVGAGARVSISGMAATRIDRMIVQIHPPANGTVIVDVRQGATAYSDTFTGDRDLVFETLP